MVYYHDGLLFIKVTNNSCMFIREEKKITIKLLGFQNYSFSRGYINTNVFKFGHRTNSETV